VVLANYFQIASFEKMHLWLPIVLEFKNTAGIFVPGTNPNSIFGKEPFITPVLAVKFQI
jgi:hypothetical protein